MKVLFLRTGSGQSDSRCEKEIYSLGKVNSVEFLGWDRTETFRGVREKEVSINGKSFVYHLFGIKAPVGEGFMKLFFPLVRFWLKEWRILFKEAKEYDAIHACDFDAAFPLLFLKSHSPIVYDIFDYYSDTHQAPKPIKEAIRRLENRIIRKSDAVIICSEARKEQILPEKPTNLIVIHNTPSLAFIQGSTANHIPEGSRCRIVYVGMLSEDRFLREMVEVIGDRLDVELHIGGYGVLEDYLKTKSQQHDNIIFYGKMNYGDVLSLERRCDVMTAIYDPRTPNHKYAAPNKFYESLMLKKPLIMMRNTGMDSYVKEYQLGEVIEGGAEAFKEGFSLALDHLIARRNQWEEMGERGFQLYQEQFSWNEMEKRLLTCYCELQKQQESNAKKKRSKPCA